MPCDINICIKLLPSSSTTLCLRKQGYKEGTTQDDPTTVVAYGLTPLIHFLHQYISMNNQRCKEVAFADNFTIAEKIEGIRSYWELLQQVGPL